MRTHFITYVFDGAILQLIVILSMLPIIELVDNYDKTFVLVMIYLLIILPLASSITIKLWVNRNNIQNAFKNCSKSCLQKWHNAVARPTDDDDDEELIDIHVNEVRVVDDNTRRNATCTTVHVNV